MFQITRDPSLGGFIQCLAKITVMVLSSLLTWMNVVGVMAAYLPVVRVCASLDCAVHTHSASLDCAVHTHSASLDCAVHTHSASLDCAVHTVPH